MELDAFQVVGVGFSVIKSYEISEAIRNLSLYLANRFYGNEISRIGLVYIIKEPRFQQVALPKPRVAKAKTYRAADVPGFPKDWPDRHVPVSLKVDYFVNFDVAAKTEGVELRRALIEPFCRELLRTPKTIQKRIDVASLSADLRKWAEGEANED